MLKLGVNMIMSPLSREARSTGAQRRTGRDRGSRALRSRRRPRHHRPPPRGPAALRDRDVMALRKRIQTRLDLEMANAAEIVRHSSESEAGTSLLVHRTASGSHNGRRAGCGRTMARLAARARAHEPGRDRSQLLFIAPDPEQIQACGRVRPQFIELHTGQFAEQYARRPARKVQIRRLKDAAQQAHDLGIKVNAGHGINYENLRDLHRSAPGGIEHRPQHRQPRRDGRITRGRGRDAAERWKATPADRVILGTGIDIIEVERIRTRTGDSASAFINRILRPGEIAYCLSHELPAPHIAARFAAKEAISKAFGTGIGQHLRWQDMEIHRKPTGEPFVVLHDRGVAHWHAWRQISSHQPQPYPGYAAAVAILEA